MNSFDMSAKKLFTPMSNAHPAYDCAFIISLKDFFNVQPADLLSYNLTSFHVFMDDVQHHNAIEWALTDVFHESEPCATFDDITVFVDKQYTTALQNEKSLSLLHPHDN